VFIHAYKSRNRGNYHVAAFTYQKGMLEPMTNWCYQTFGHPGDCKDNARWEDSLWLGEAWFRDERDLIMFVLRWS
jgi:hypothetical protein